MRIIFRGGEAEQNRLAAYEGLKSLDGLVRVATIASHYSVTGEVRFRAPYSNILEPHLSGIRNGSFVFVFDQIGRFVDQVEEGVAKLKSEAIFSRLLARGTGQAAAQEMVVEGEQIPAADIDAMAEAAEAAIRAAHRWIESEGKSIEVVDGDEIVALNMGTKEYVETELKGPEKTKDVSVASLNVNNKSGRVFFFDEGRTVPFSIARDADPRTMPNLSKYLNEYANDTGAKVNIRYQEVTQLDGRMKRVIVFDCFEARDAA